MDENGHTRSRHLWPVVPVMLVVALLVGATCGAPDEVKRVSQAQVTGGNTGGTSAQGGSGGSAGSPATPPPGGSSTSGIGGSSGGTGGRSSVGGAGSSGNTTVTGGGGGRGGTTATGGTTTAGGSVSAGGSTRTGGTTGAGGTGGAGGRTSPFGGSGGATVVGGTTGPSTGGVGGSSGEGGSTATPPPANGLGVYLTKAVSSSPGQISLSLRIDNKTTQPVDMSTVSLRYWYKEEALGSALVVASNYVSIGYSNTGKVVDVKAIAFSGGAGADHYLEFAFTATLAAQGDKNSNDQFNVQVSVHNSGYSGAVDVTNDYSYNAGATGYDDKITLHDNSGKVIWGTPPSGGGAVSADAGASGGAGGSRG